MTPDPVAKTELSAQARRVRRMARATGIDLQAKLREGRITPDDLSDRIQSCSRCTALGACKGWMDMQRTTGDGAAARTPGFCRNKPWFDGLGAGI